MVWWRGKGELHLVLFHPGLSDQGRNERKDEDESFTELLFCSWRHLQYPCPFLAGMNSGTHNRLLACVGAAVSQNIPKLKHSRLSCLGTWLVKMQSSREIIQAPHRKWGINLSCCKGEAKGITFPQTYLAAATGSDGRKWGHPTVSILFWALAQSTDCFTSSKFRNWCQDYTHLICQMICQSTFLASAWRSKKQWGHKPAKSQPPSDITRPPLQKKSFQFSRNYTVASRKQQHHLPGKSIPTPNHLFHNKKIFVSNPNFLWCNLRPFPLAFSLEAWPKKLHPCCNLFSDSCREQ